MSTLMIAATLALGIGATTAVYAMFSYLLFRPVPGIDPTARFVTLAFSTPDRGVLAYGNRAALPAMRAAGSEAGLEYLADHCCGSAVAVAPVNGPAAWETADFVTSQFFAAVGVRARIGRLLTDEEADTGSSNVVVISERLWRAEFGGTTAAIGQTMTVNGHPFEIVGVTDGFRGWGRWTARVGDIDLWLPMAAQRAVTGQDSAMTAAVGRVRENAELGQIEQRLQAVYASGAWTTSPRDRAFMPFVDPGLWSAPYAQNTAAQHLFRLLMAGVALLLVLACANAANLLLVRLGRRVRDTAVRLALGASRWHIIRQSLVESIGLAFAAGVLGLAVTVILIRTVRDVRILPSLPSLTGLAIDARVLTCCLVVTIVTVLVFGVVPAIVSSRTRIRETLGHGGRAVASKHRLQRVLMMLQVGLSLALLVGAGVLFRSLERLLSADLGMDLRQVTELVLRPQDLGYDNARSKQIMTSTIDALRRAGFHEVAISYGDPLAAMRNTIAVRTHAMSQPEQIHPTVRSVSPDYFRVLRIPLLAGRTLSEAEYGESAAIDPMPVILNASLAQHIFGAETAVGQTFEMDRSIGMATIHSTAVVVGVVGVTRSSGVRAEPADALYHGRTGEWRYATILLRSEPGASAIEPRVRAAVQAADPRLPVTALRPLADEVADDLAEDRVLARLSALFAVVAVLLAATGVAAVVGQLVAERTRDFGIRIALGASSAQVLGHVLAGVLLQSATASAGGLVLYAMASRALQTHVYGVTTRDPVTMIVAATGLLVVALIAALFPASRATRVDPAIALRAE